MFPLSLTDYSDLLVFVALSLIIGYTDEENKITSGVTVSIPPSSFVKVLFFLP